MAILDNTELLAGALDDGTGGEVQLTISAHSTVVTFATATATNYEDGDAGHHGFFTLTIVGNTGNETLAVIFDDDNTAAKSTSADRDITVNVDTTGSDFDDGNTIAEAVRVALEDEDLTISRNANVLTVTNQVGGLGATTTEDTNGGVTITTTTAGGAITAATINTAGSGFTAGGAYAIGNGEITITPTAAGNPRLLADSWLGLTDTVGIPTTSIAVTPINISSGSRNIAYNLKGAESTASGNLNVSANHFTWLYYALGTKAITTTTGAGAVVIDTSPSTDAPFLTTGQSGNNFIYDTDVPSEGFHRVIGNVICPPLNQKEGQNTGNIKKISHTLTNKITYTFSESNEQTLPTFALEYSLKKPSSMSTVATDVSGAGISETVFTKIFPGCMVDTLSMSAASGEPVSMNVGFSPKKTYTAPNNYDTANAKTDVKDFVNFGSPKGGAANVTESQLQPFFFSDGTIEMFGQDYIRLENIELSISNALQEKRFIGRTDKTSTSHIPSQRIYGLSFTGLVTDNAIFEELRNTSATSLSGTDGNQIKLNFVKNGATTETLSMVFQDYMVVEADFPLTNDKGPVAVTWRIQPLQLKTCTHATNWIIQG